ncbi:MAG: hypothetical protein AAGF26_13465 [Cyanobacteria bacterium P01_G01_bin.49]
MTKQRNQKKIAEFYERISYKAFSTSSCSESLTREYCLNRALEKAKQFPIGSQVIRKENNVGPRWKGQTATVIDHKIDKWNVSLILRFDDPEIEKQHNRPYPWGEPMDWEMDKFIPIN